ncbi:MAG: Tol-Pal system protein TolB [Pseudomonadota bacterium]
MTYKKLILISIFLLSFSSSANAAINFRIDSKDIPKTKILVSTTDKNNPQAGAIKADLEEILSRVKRNLKSTDLFDIAQKDIASVGAGNVAGDLSIEKIPDFVRYSGVGVGMLLIVDGSFNQTPSALRSLPLAQPPGDLEIKVRLWDVLDERQLFGKFYSSNKSNYKKMASLISDEIFKAATSEKMGHFDSKITYIAESGSATKRVKRIVIMDFDGENRRYLTNGRDLVLTPIFSRQKNEILFVRFFGEKPQIYSLDTNNALVRKVGSFRGTTFAPTISPSDANVIAFSVIENGNSNIYQMNLFTNQTTRLTSTRAIDTTPSYSPDGKRIVFSSDRGGNEQLYIMNSDGGNARKISTDSGSYSKPMWSPDGKFIAFTKLKANQFSIGIIDVDGRNEKTLTSGYLVEGAKWSPSGRYIIYSRKNGAYGKASVPKLYVIDVLTGFERELPTAENEGATDPDWMMN